MSGRRHAADETVSCENVDELKSVGVGLHFKMNIDVTDKQDWFDERRDAVQNMTAH